MSTSDVGGISGKTNFPTTARLAKPTWTTIRTRLTATCVVGLHRYLD